MSWTTLVAEYLAIGLQVLVWMTLLIFRIENISLSAAVDWIQALRASLAGILAMLMVVFCYSIGLLFDRVFNAATELRSKRIVKKWWEEFERKSKENGEKNVGRRFYAAEDAIRGPDGQRDCLGRRRGRIRILRAMLFNVPFVAGSVFWHYPEWWPLILGASIECLVLLAFRNVLHQYVRMIHRKAQRPTTNNWGDDGRS